VLSTDRLCFITVISYCALVLSTDRLCFITVISYCELVLSTDHVFYHYTISSYVTIAPAIVLEISLSLMTVDLQQRERGDLACNLPMRE